jgi:prevent-host-death family protein
MTFAKHFIWSLFDAKAKLSELVERALKDGPQLVTRRGRPAVVVIAVEEYERLRSPGESFKDFLRTGPAAELDLERINSDLRPIEL